MSDPNENSSVTLPTGHRVCFRLLKHGELEAVVHGADGIAPLGRTVDLGTETFGLRLQVFGGSAYAHLNQARGQLLLTRSPLTTSTRCAPASSTCKSMPDTPNG